VSSDTRQSRVFNPADQPIADYRIAWLTRIVYGNAFEFTIVGLIAINAAFLAILTLPDIDPGLAAIAQGYDRIVLWIYIAELALRIISYGKKPWMFFTGPWNVFDFLVIALIPVFSNQTVILRLLRLLRIVRLFRFMPEVRILTNSIVRSLPPLASVTVLIMFLLFLYAMAGHYLFGDALPESWGDIGKSMESLLILLTLENFPNYFEEAMAVNTGVTLFFFLSYVFIIVFTILNVLIGIVINAMDESRSEENKRTRDHWREMTDALDGLEKDGTASAEDVLTLREQILTLRRSTEGGAGSSGSSGSGGRGDSAKSSTLVKRGAGKRTTGRSSAGSHNK
jgi:voltage-gated sodium channel